MKNLLAALLLLPAGASAEEHAPQAYACLQGVGTSTTWGQCLNQVFAPCADNAIGSEPHLACLLEVRESWRVETIDAQAAVQARLDGPGNEALEGLLQAWPKFVEQKCNAAAQSRADISAEAAYLGCEISEMLLLANELRACLGGRSVEEYCSGAD